MDKLRDIVLFVAGLVAIGSLIMAAFEGFNQRIGSATFLGGFGLVCVMIVFIPQLEALKAFGVEAKLRETYKEAVATLASVRRLAEISARASYLVIAWGNRLDGPSAKERQAVLDQIEDQLTELKVAPQQRTDIQRPFLKMVKLDFYFLFSGVLMQYAKLLNDQLVSNVHTAQDASVASRAVMHHSELITAWQKRTYNENPAADLEHQSLEGFLDGYMPKTGEWLNDNDLKALEKFKAEVVRLNADCEKKGGYTAEAAEFYDRYGRDHTIDKATELRREAGQ
jgi:hypothetical protein